MEGACKIERDLIVATAAAAAAGVRGVFATEAQCQLNNRRVFGSVSLLLRFDPGLDCEEVWKQIVRRDCSTSLSHSLASVVQIHV